MSDILVQFDEPQLCTDGRMFTAEVRGQRLPTGLWEAWIEFYPRIGGEPVRTPPETEQLSRGDLRFWAAGITRAHLADALATALNWCGTASPDVTASTTGLSQNASQQAALDTNLMRTDAPILDPIAVYQRSGEYTLRQELRGLDARQLDSIIAAFNIAEMDVIDLARTYEDALAERIVAGVQHNVGSNRSFSAEPDVQITE